MSASGAIIIEGHVQGLSNARALGEIGIPIIVIDKDICLAKFSKYCKKFYKCPDYTSNDFIEFLIHLAEKENLKDWVLIPSNDHIVKNLSGHKELIQKYFKTIVPDFIDLQNVINKKNLIKIANSCQVPTPYTIYGDDFKQGAHKLVFPVLVKGNEGLTFYKTFHSKAIVANNFSELNSIIQNVNSKLLPEEIMIQELIKYDPNHKVISFTAFAIRGIIKSFWIGAKLREHPIKFGTATLSQSIHNEECLKNSEVLLKKLNYTGVCEIEFLFDPSDLKFKLIEINPRTWLWVGLAKTCGINYPLMIYNYLNGINTVYPTKYSIGLKWINYLTDTVFSIIAILKKQITISEYFKQLKGKKINAVFSKSDLLPGIIFPFLGFYIAKKRR